MNRLCTRCIYPDTKTDLFFDDEGVCSACRSFETRASVDWDAPHVRRGLRSSVRVEQRTKAGGLALSSAEPIERALGDVVRERGALTAVTRVRGGNLASRRLFDALGFAPAEWHADHVVSSPPGA